MKILKKYKAFFLLLIMLSIGILIGSVQQIFNDKITVNEKTSLKLTPEQLSRYNGDDQDSPIYIGLNGYVYDVTSGKDFYKPGAAYHDLAGKDSSKLLNLVGGEIIRRKYPIIGEIIN